MEYISSTYLLEKIQNQVLILNNPAEIRNCSEKIFVTDFANLTPKTIFTKSIDKIEKFREKHSKIILKPLYACGGEGISLIDKNTKNLPEIFKELQENFEGPIIAQEFLPEIKDGDKRILLLNGEPIGIIARIPAKNEIRANFHAGGSAKKVELSKKELEICKKIGPELKKRGLFFVGIDVIGDFITEINVTSPTGINEINQANNCRIEEKIVEEIEKEFLKFKKLT
jgi:glutathione synthase